MKHGDDTAQVKQRMVTEPLRVSVKEAARLIGLSPVTVYKLIKAGAIRPVYDSGRTLFTMTELRSYVERTASFDSNSGVSPRHVGTKLRHRE
jgi:excisionase family DNA binding protein